jgi:hypothetical protein
MSPEPQYGRGGRLKDSHGNILSNTWNIERLHNFFP